MKKDKVIIIFFAICIFAFWAGTWILLGDSPNDERGTFGDMFGAVNALFSGFAFLGVIYAILLQRTELSLQRKELELTREELKKSADAQEKSEQALAAQAKAMERTALISSLTASVESLEKRMSSLKLSGDFRIVEQNKKQRGDLQKKVHQLTNKLDSLMDETLDS